MNNIHPLSLAIIVANVLITYKGFKDVRFFERYKLNVAAIKNGQWDRVITAAFLHVDTSHLIFNMFTFYFFGDIVIYRLGVLGFIWVYFASLLVGNIFSYYYHKKEPYYSAVGASGAVTGTLYAAIALFPDMRLGIFFIPIPLPAYWVGLGYMLYTLYGMKKANDNIGHTAHFAGAITGLIVALLLSPLAILAEPVAIIALLLPLVLFVIMERKRFS